MTRQKEVLKQWLTRLCEGNDAFGLGGELVDLLVVRDAGLHRLVRLHAVHVHELGDWRDSRQGPAGHVRRLLQAQLVQYLLLDGLEANRPDLLVHAAGVAGAAHRQSRARRADQAVQPPARGLCRRRQGRRVLDEAGPGGVERPEQYQREEE